MLSPEECRNIGPDGVGFTRVDGRSTKIEPVTSVPTAPSTPPPIQDGGYEVGTVEQAKAQEQERPTVREIVQSAQRRLVLELARTIKQAESGSVIVQPFDKNDVSDQKYIRMAKAVCLWLAQGGR